ncbi:MAG: hypothetical protein M0C28_23105 [Candidatus Moduliflexus flocculans]|nr:hypothetical protein [Candidatus Moduliflexus flocculans]
MAVTGPRCVPERRQVARDGQPCRPSDPAGERRYRASSTTAVPGVPARGPKVLRRLRPPAAAIRFWPIDVAARLRGAAGPAQPSDDLHGPDTTPAGCPDGTWVQGVEVFRRLRTLPSDSARSSR